MELVFTKSSKKWVAEMSVTEDFNLHIEGVKNGNISVYQRGIESGAFAYVKGGTLSPSLGEVYDVDFSSTIYPKYIRVECVTQPTMAEIITDGEVTFIEVPEDTEDGGIELLEYNFRLPVERYDEIFEELVSAYDERDFSNEYDSISKFVKKYGEESEYEWHIGEYRGAPLENPKITVNGYDVTEITIYKNYDNIEMSTNCYEVVGSGGHYDCYAGLSPTSMYMDYGIFRQTFNFDMQDDLPFGYTYYDTGDYKDLHNLFARFIKANATPDEYGSYYLYEDEVSVLADITVNGYKVIEMYLYSDNLISMPTTAPWYMGGGSDFNITENGISFEYGPER